MLLAEGLGGTAQGLTRLVSLPLFLRNSKKSVGPLLQADAQRMPLVSPDLNQFGMLYYPQLFFLQ